MTKEEYECMKAMNKLCSDALLKKQAEDYIASSKDYCVEHGESCVTDAFIAGFRAGVVTAQQAGEKTERGACPGKG